MKKEVFKKVFRLEYKKEYSKVGNKLVKSGEFTLEHIAKQLDIPVEKLKIDMEAEIFMLNNDALTAFEIEDAEENAMNL